MLKNSRLIPEEEQSRLLQEYPIYSQDGKKGEAVCPVRIYLSGSTFYVLEFGDLDNDLELYLVYDDGQVTEYGYQLLSELEEASVDQTIHEGGEPGEDFIINVKSERETGFAPTKLKDIPQLKLWIWKLSKNDIKE